MEKQILITPVIIPSLEPDDRFLKLLAELSAQKIEPIVVVDDGSGENAPAPGNPESGTAARAAGNAKGAGAAGGR